MSWQMYRVTFLSFILKASTWQDAIRENQMWNIVSWAVSQTPTWLDVKSFSCFDYFLTIPFDSLRLLLNKATWKCPFVLGGTTITIFFLVFTWCTVCVFINDAVNFFFYSFWTWFKENGAKLNVTFCVCVADWDAAWVVSCFRRRKGKKFLSLIQAVPVFICIMQLNLYKTLFVIKL